MPGSSGAALRELLADGLRYLSTGDLANAGRTYEKVLAADPQNAEALHLLGVVRLQAGHADDALALIDRSLAANPQDAAVHSNRGNVLQALARHEEAVAAYRASLLIAPDVAVTHANLGNALGELDRWHEAIEAYHAALALRPGLAEVHRNLAGALLAQGKPEQAFNEIYKALALAPHAVEARLTLGNILLNLSRPEDAATCYRDVLGARPRSPEILCNLGNALRRAGKLGDAIAQYEHALAIDPAYVDAHYGRAMAHEEAGEFDAAKQRLRQVLELNPHLAKAWRSLAGLNRWADVDDPDLAAIHREFERGDLRPSEKLELAFALGKCHDDLGHIDEAFEYYRIANRLRRDGIDYAIDAEVRLFDNLKATFHAGLYETPRAPVEIPGPRPIFILGMPRSGTTLVEQILASHPQVYGGGELNALPQSISRNLEMLDGVDYTRAFTSARPEALRRVADAYLATLRELAPDRAFVTDKLPMNFLNLGMIRLLFPDVPVIHCLRQPLGTCFSIWCHNFAAKGHYYAYDMTELGRYYRMYQDLMAHWREVLPGDMYEVEYEKLVADQEHESRALVAYCGLDWDPACLDFHKTTRQVQTISATQVRQPMYKRSMEHWRAYEAHLAPLAKALGTARD